MDAQGKRLRPAIGQWYHHRDKGEDFCVVDADRSADLIELQHFDGDLEAVDFSEWHSMILETIPEPEDWTGPVDTATVQDPEGPDLRSIRTGDWRQFMEELHEFETEMPEETVAVSPELDSTA